MKSVTATDARRDWFRLLDEVAAGEVVVIERRGRRLVLRLEEAVATDDGVTDYGNLLEIRGEDDLELWGWQWEGPETPPRAVRRERREDD